MRYMVRTLIVLRHAKSDWPVAVPDIQRPLSDRGRRDAPAAGRWLSHTDLVPDVALVSVATRTRQTWDLAAAQLPRPVPAEYVEEMYAADWSDLLGVARSADPQYSTVIMVGHNPGSEDLATQLSGPGSDESAVARMAVKYPTAAIAVLEVPGDWTDLEPGSARLRDFVVPRG